MKFCTYCGAQLLNETARFCSKCGAKIMEVPPPAEQPRTWSEPISQPEEPHAWADTATATLEKQEEAPPTKEPSSSLLESELLQEDVQEIPKRNLSEDFSHTTTEGVPSYKDNLDEMPIQPLEDFNQTIPDPYLQQGLQEEEAMQGAEDFGANIPYVHAEIVGEQINFSEQGPPINLSESKDKPAKAAKSKQPKPPKPKKKKKLLPALLLTFLAFALVGGGIFGFILYNNSPQVAVKEFVKALQTKDTQYLVENTAVLGEPLTKEQARTLCKAFEDSASIEELTAHLLDEVNEEYDSFSMSTVGTTLKSYQVKIRPATVEIVENVDDFVLLADGVEVALKTAKNASTASLLPGKYTLVGNYVAGGTKGTTEPQEVSLYSTTVPVELDMTVEVTTPAPPIPSAVAPAQKEEPVGEETPVLPDGDALVTQVSDVYYDYYISYLKAINEWDTSYLVHVDDSFWNKLVERMETNNEDYIFEFVDMSLDKDSMQHYTENGNEMVSINAHVSYRYTYRNNSSKWYDGGNYQNIYFVYNEAQMAWRIANIEIRNNLTMSKNTIDYSSY